MIVIPVSHDDAYSAKILEPASSAVPKAADNYYGDNDKKSCVVHIVLLLGDKRGPRAGRVFLKAKAG